MRNSKEILDAKREIEFIGRSLDAMREAEKVAVDIRGEIEGIRRDRDKAEAEYRESILDILDELIKQQNLALKRLNENIKSTQDSLDRLIEEEKERHARLPKIDIGRSELNVEIEKLNVIITDLKAKRLELSKEIENLKVTAQEYDLKAEQSINTYIKCQSQTKATQESPQQSM
jgi:chromosome segregation ATPase